MRKFFGSIILLLSMLACGSTAPATPSQTELETIVAATLESLTAAAPTQVDGTGVAINNISFVIPPEIGTGSSAETIEAALPADDMPWWAVYPTHQKYSIQGYVWQNAFHKPALYIYPVDEYTQLNEDVGKRIEALKTLLNSPGQPLPQNLPFLPTFNAGQIFYSQLQVINFQNGSGIRYITQYDQAPLPINNDEVFYTFQGITNDGKYYVAAVLPINSPLLAENGSPDSATPAGGIPFEWDPDKFELLPSYIAAVTQLLNTSDPNSFNPTLPLLDQFIQSTKVISQ